MSAQSLVLCCPHQLNQGSNKKKTHITQQKIIEQLILRQILYNTFSIFGGFLNFH
jgi:hypothetical protein